MQKYFIEILQKVSFDKILFLKELQKSRRWLKPEEYANVLHWACENYNEMFETVEKPAESECIRQVN
jgi:hypothetical protein